MANGVYCSPWRHLSHFWELTLHITGGKMKNKVQTRHTKFKVGELVNTKDITGPSFIRYGNGRFNAPDGAELEAWKISQIPTIIGIVSKVIDLDEYQVILQTGEIKTFEIRCIKKLEEK
jgi:hypothetical protein